MNVRLLFNISLNSLNIGLETRPSYRCARKKMATSRSSQEMAQKRQRMSSLCRFTAVFLQLETQKSQLLADQSVVTDDFEV
jgi:hypothetical protein